MVGARVLPHHEDQLRVVDVVQGHGALADADGRIQRRTGGLVAHVRAVRQVVGAQGPGEQLVHERRLVRRAPRGVEDAAVRRAGPDMLADQLERLRPGDRRIVGLAFADHHGFAEPALVAQPVFGLPRQLGDGMLRPRTRPRPCAGCSPPPPPWRRSRRTRPPCASCPIPATRSPGSRSRRAGSGAAATAPSGTPRPGPRRAPAPPSRPSRRPPASWVYGLPAGPR